MTIQAEAGRHALTADDRMLVRWLVDREVRRRQAKEAARTAAIKRRYHASRA